MKKLRVAAQLLCSSLETSTLQVKKKKIIRKVREIFLALKIESTLSKEKILELYFNKIYLGHRAYGVAAAAQIYYGKKIDQLTLAEIAMIAGLPKAPSRYNPVTNMKRAMQRRNYVLKECCTMILFLIMITLELIYP